MRGWIVAALGLVLATGAGCSRKSSLFLDPGREEAPSQAQPAQVQPAPSDCAPEGHPVPAGRKPCPPSRP